MAEYVYTLGLKIYLTEEYTQDTSIGLYASPGNMHIYICEADLGSTDDIAPGIIARNGVSDITYSADLKYGGGLETFSGISVSLVGVIGGVQTWKALDGILLSGRKTELHLLKKVVSGNPTPFTATVKHIGYIRSITHSESETILDIGDIEEHRRANIMGVSGDVDLPVTFGAYVKDDDNFRPVSYVRTDGEKEEFSFSGSDIDLGINDGVHIKLLGRRGVTQPRRFSALPVIYPYYYMKNEAHDEWPQDEIHVLLGNILPFEEGEGSCGFAYYIGDEWVEQNEIAGKRLSYFETDWYLQPIEGIVLDGQIPEGDEQPQQQVDDYRKIETCTLVVDDFTKSYLKITLEKKTTGDVCGARRRDGETDVSGYQSWVKLVRFKNNFANDAWECKAADTKQDIYILEERQTVRQGENADDVLPVVTRDTAPRQVPDTVVNTTGASNNTLQINPGTLKDENSTEWVDIVDIDPETFRLTTDEIPASTIGGDGCVKKWDGLFAKTTDPENIGKVIFGRESSGLDHDATKITDRDYNTYYKDRTYNEFTSDRKLSA